MFCGKCGTQFEGNFCPKCGEPVGATEPQEVPVEQILNFYHGKDFGYFTYKHTATSVEVLPTTLTIYQINKSIFRKAKKTEKTVPISTIASARVHTTVAFWDIIYTAIFALLSILNPWCILLAIIWFFFGAYGKEIEITTTGGDKIKIPTGKVTQDTETLLHICKK